jgi:glycosyltransferase involved in cell wall biosynthesis
MKMAKLSLIIPVYNDAFTIRNVVEKALMTIPEFFESYEIVLINDGSTDNSKELCDQLCKEYQFVFVRHNNVNQGYAEVYKLGIEYSKQEWICFCDGDDEYDISDLSNLAKQMKHYDMIITFRYKRLYSKIRVLVSWVYNALLRFLFGTKYRDISTGLKLVKKEVLSDLNLESESTFVGAEMVVKAMLMGYPIGEVGIQTYPQSFRKSFSFSFKNTVLTIKDISKVYNSIFSSTYKVSNSRKRY